MSNFERHLAIWQRLMPHLPIARLVEKAQESIRKDEQKLAQ